MTHGETGNSTERTVDVLCGDHRHVEVSAQIVHSKVQIHSWCTSWEENQGNYERKQTYISGRSVGVE